jgi:hypothetical protein
MRGGNDYSNESSGESKRDTEEVMTKLLSIDMIS